MDKNITDKPNPSINSAPKSDSGLIRSTDKCRAKERDIDREKDCNNGKPTIAAYLRFYPDKNLDCVDEATSKFKRLQPLCENKSTNNENKSTNTSVPLLEADKNENKPISENNHDVTITTKIYPTTYKNRKGFRVGNMKIKFDTKNSPFTSTDQIDHYLNELFSYIKWASVKKDPKEETIEDRKKSIYDFLKAKKIEHVFSPKFVVDENKGGKKKTTRKRQGKSTRKTSKRKIKVYKGGNNDREIQKYIVDSIQMELPDQLERVLKMHPGYVNKPLPNGKLPIELANDITDDESRTDMLDIIKTAITKTK